MRLVDDLTLERGTSLHEKPGTTCTGVSAKGPAVEWELCLPGRPLLTVHDTRWDNGGRDLVLYQPTVVPEIPAALSNLHNRLRVGIARAPVNTTTLRIMAFPAWVDGERPRFKKSLTTAQLAAKYGLQQLRDLTARPGVALHSAGGRVDVPGCDVDDPQDDIRMQHALSFPVEDDETPVIAFTHLRVVPVLRHVGWLSMVAV
ncbi:hypothetical protein ACIPD2_18190 [Streptomyces griseofuscus]|uniref:hypothetical protein n=1 Tax=Streptomyces griseofuscus TaxID=146922 RepID=UPI0037FB72C1